MFRRIAASTAVAILTSLVLVLDPISSASAHSCGSNWCSGSDSETAHNVQGNGPQIYWGEVGVYYIDFGGGSGPCPNSGAHDGSCFNYGGANAAQSRWNAGQGLGTQFYYLGGGAASEYESEWGSPYCFGWRQGYLAAQAAANDFTSYDGTAYLMAIDIEGGSSGLGWAFNDEAANRQVFDGFTDFLADRSSADPTYCNYSNPFGLFQYAVYSSPYQWSNSFRGYSTVHATPIWTSENCCYSSWPQPPYDHAAWFGGSYSNFSWQFDDTVSLPDYDQAYEPLYMPLWNLYLGN